MTHPTQFPPLPDDHEAQVLADAQAEDDNLRRLRFGDVIASDRLARHSQTGDLFAVFGPFAYRLATWTDEHPRFGAYQFTPALSAGVAYLSRPDEGNSGVYYWVYNPRPQQWRLQALPVGWIKTEELEQTTEQIAAHIAEELDSERLRYEFEQRERAKMGL